MAAATQAASPNRSPVSGTFSAAAPPPASTECESEVQQDGEDEAAPKLVVASPPRENDGPTGVGLDIKLSNDVTSLTEEEEEHLLAAMSQGYAPPPVSRESAFCCVCRPTNGSVEPEKKVWQTANLWWWDFQKRRWKSINLMINIQRRVEDIIAKTKDQPGTPESAALWEEYHAVTAREIREHVEDSKGLFVKACQVISASTHGIVPNAYIEEFMKLTEHMPVSLLDEVSRTIRRNLGQSLLMIFSEFNPEPIGSASIAQVHKARLRSTGEVVAVKVQHEGVDRLCWEDADTLCWIAQRVKAEHKELDFVEAMEEMRSMLSKELDFREECRAASRARQVLLEAGSEVVVPFMHENICGQHVLVMEYIEGDPIMKLQDDAFCAENSLDKCAIMEEFVNAFGIMLFKDGLVHLDPHAGNVRLTLDPEAKGGARAVLLDWGLFCELSDHDRLGMSLWFHSMANLDMAGTFNALELLGIKIRLDVVTKLLRDSRGSVGETKNRKEVRKKFDADMQKFTAKLEARAKGASKEKDNSEKPAVEMESFPKSLANYARMIQLVKGLCTAVDASGIQVLRIFTTHAREALVEASLRQSLTSGIFNGTEGEAASACHPRGATMEAQLQCLLAELSKSRHVVGAQLAVFEGKTAVCSVVAGTLSTVDMRPVRQGTRFRLMGMTSGLAALACLRTLRRLADNAAISARCGRDGESKVLREREHVLSTPVTNIWPEFGLGRDCPTTLADILGYTASVQDNYPQGFPLHLLDDPAAMSQHFEGCPMQSGKEGHYAYLLNPFLMAKLAELLAGKESLLQWLVDELGPLGLDITAPFANAGVANVCRDIPADALEKLARDMEGAGDALKAASMSSSSTPTANGSSNISLIQAMQSNPIILDPLFANCQGDKFRAGLSLAASAYGLAKMLSSESLKADLKALGALRPAGADTSGLGWRLSGGANRWTVGGLQVVELKARSLWSRLASHQDGYGVICGFGPCVVHFPNVAPGGVTIAVTVNDMTWGFQTASKVLAQVLRHYGYAPAWTSMPMRVRMEAIGLAAHLGRAHLPNVVQSARSGMTGLTSRLPDSLRCSRRAVKPAETDTVTQESPSAPLGGG